MKKHARELTLVTMAVLTTLSPSAPLLALDPKKAITQYVHDTWPQEALPQVSVHSMAQTRDGYLWLATEEGFVRFDGVRFTVFDRRNTPELRSRWISTLLAGREGSLWIGTDGGGLSRLRDGKLTTYTTKAGLSTDTVTALHEDSKGDLWIGTFGGGLNRLRDGRFTTLTTKDGLAGPNVSALAEDRQGSLWIGHPGAGLDRLKDGTFTTYTTKDGLASGVVRCLVEGRDGSLWVGTDKGLNRLRDGTFTTYTTRDGLPGDVVSSLVEDRDGNLWIGTWGGGLARLSGGTFSSFSRQQGLTYDYVGSLLEDREGSLWVGTPLKGLNRLRDARLTAFTEREGLSSDSLLLLLESRDGSVWVSDTDYLDRIDNGKCTPTPFTRGGPRSGPDNHILALVESRDGSLWIGTSHRGLHRLKDGKLTAFTTKDGLASDKVGRLLEDREGGLWIGTSKGINRLKDGRLTTFTTKDGLLADAARQLLEDREGSLWIVTPKGLNRMKDGKITSLTTKDGLLSDSISGLFEDRKGSLWIGSALGLNRLRNGEVTSFRKAENAVLWNVSSHLEDREGTLWFGTTAGLYRFRNGALTSVTTKKGLFDDNVWAIVEDERDNLWMSCNRGIFRASRKELNDVADGKAKGVSCVSYGTADGLKSAECNSVNAIRTRDGRLWFPTVDGVVVVDPAHLPTNPDPPPVVVEEVLVDGKVAERPATGSVLVVPPGKEKLEIHYTALSLAVPKRVRFKVRLEGYDPGWVEAGTERVAHYMNLPPRAYTFRVIACNDDGLWNEKGASLAITLLPRFWQTWWFRGLEGLAGLGAIAGVLLLQRRRLDLRKARELADELRTAELSRKTEELEHARRVQLALLPKEPLTAGDWTVAGGMQTATEVGGDYYGYLEVGGRLCVVIGDATGHGMASGLVAGMLKSAVATLSQTEVSAHAPSKWLADLNTALRASISQRGLGVCLGIGLVDIGSGQVDLGMAGIPHSFHVSASGRVERLRLSGTPLGYLKRLLPATATRTLEPDDRLVLITDGLIEQVNAAGEQWGYAGVEAALSKLVENGAPDVRAGTIAEELLAACERYGAGQPRSDDRTVVVLVRRSRGAS